MSGRPLCSEVDMSLATVTRLPLELIEELHKAVGCQMFVHRLGYECCFVSRHFHTFLCFRSTFVPLREIWQKLDFDQAYKDAADFVSARWKHGVIQRARDKVVSNDHSLDFQPGIPTYNSPPPVLLFDSTALVILHQTCCCAF